MRFRKYFRSTIAATAGLLLIGAVVVAAPASSATAAACQLGPSIGAVANEVGIACPGTEAGGTGEHSWGAAMSACNYGWDNSQLPAGFLSYPTGTGYTYSFQHFPDDSQSARMVWTDGKGAVKAMVNIRTFADHRFVMGIHMYGRDGIAHEGAFFDCRSSKNGPVYITYPGSWSIPLPAVGTPPTSTVDAGWIKAAGAMTQLTPGRYLLRVDVTNDGPQADLATVYLDLKGYQVQSIPTLSPLTTCTPDLGLVCSTAGILPGQTISTVLVLDAVGDDVDTTEIDVSVIGSGLVRSRVDVTHPLTMRPDAVMGHYVVSRP